MVRILDIKEYAKKNNVPIMQDEGIEFICKYIEENNVKKILEIGSAIGYSALKFASIADDIIVTTIERDENRYKEAVSNINNMNMNHQINIYHADALDIDIKDKYDLIFIDAAKAQYTNFFNLYSPLLSDDGIIITDNMLFHGVKIEDAKSRSLRGLIRKLNNYTDFLLNNPLYDTTIFNLGDGMALTSKRH